jgi:hypothetical protein
MLVRRGDGPLTVLALSEQVAFMEARIEAGADVIQNRRWYVLGSLTSAGVLA